MVANAQKTPIARSLEEFANRKLAGEEQLDGRFLPCSVVSVVSAGIVKVKVEVANVPYVLQQLTVPVGWSEYVRIPVQQGMLGWLMSADAYLGGVSGLGGGTADLTRRPNLSNLVFSPIGNKNWGASEDPNKLILYGPDGAVLRTMDKAVGLTVASTGFDFNMGAGGGFTIHNLPVAPTTPGALYNSGGTVKISP